MIINENEKVFLIKGDISGIQEYIFNVTSKGAAKALHEHSCKIMELEKKYTKKLEVTLGLNGGQKGIKGGGGFHFILENDTSQDLDARLNSLQNKINSDLKLLPVTIRIASGKGNDFQEAWKALRKNNNEKRYRFYDGINGHLFEGLFTPFNKEEAFPEDELATNSRDTVENVKWTDIPQTYTNDKAVEIRKDDFVDFDGYASFANVRTGTDFLGVLKMDVDNLGDLFGKCNTVEDFKKQSNFFNTFFGKEHIEELLDQAWHTDETFHQNIYTVFAGGDDCFFIGAWDAILDFAKELHTEFENEVKESFGENSGISLSAGIILLDAKTPVVQLGKMAEEALSEAKKRQEGGKTEKNAVCLMNEIFTWEDYNRILEQTQTLTKFLSGTDKKITRGLLEKIKKSSIGFDRLQQRIKRGKSLPFDRVYKLKYYLRDVKKDHVAEVEQKIFKPYIDALTEVLMNQNKEFPSDYINPMQFPMAARLTEFKTRNLKNNTHE